MDLKIASGIFGILDTLDADGDIQAWNLIKSFYYFSIKRIKFETLWIEFELLSTWEARRLLEIIINEIYVPCISL